MGKQQRSTETMEQAFDAGDEGQVGERQIKSKNMARERMAGLVGMMQSKNGRAYIWWLLGECKVFSTSFTGNSTTFFNEGMRQIGLMLLADINRECEDQYLVMCKENR